MTRQAGAHSVGGAKRTDNIVIARAVEGISNVRVQNTRLHTKGSTARSET